MSNLATKLQQLISKAISTSKYHSNKRRSSANGLHTSPVGAVTLLILMCAIGLAVVNNANDTYAASSTLSLSISNSTVSMDISPTNVNGSFNKSSASTISASTDNATGYTLSIAAPTNAGTNYDKLINSSDSTAKLNSISSATTEEQFKALDDKAYNGMWGYLPSKLCTTSNNNTTCATNTSFLPAPTISGDTLDITTAANTTANTYTIAIGARVDSSVKTGSYSNTYVVKLVGNAIAYTITYIDDSVSNMPIDVDTTTPNTSVNVSSTTPVRNGYTFIAWCTVTPTVNANGTDTCSGTQYNAGASITINQTSSNNNYTLHAMWSENYSIAHVTYLQDFATMTADKRSKVILSMVPGEFYTLNDSRDETTYHITKLKDGNVWLADNLALDLVAKIDDLNEDNTNASNTTLGYLKGTSTGTTSDKYATAKVSNWTSSYSFSAPLVNISDKDVVPTAYNGTDDPMKDQVVAGNWKVGGYYNYCAATAGSYCYGNGTSAGTSSGNATEDICPKGWRMPTGNTSGEYQALYNNSSYNTYANYRLALRLPLSGGFYSGSAGSQGKSGNFWSSTRYNNNNYMYDLSLDTSIVRPSNRDSRYNGLSIRCLLSS